MNATPGTCFKAMTTPAQLENWPSNMTRRRSCGRSRAFHLLIAPQLSELSCSLSSTQHGCMTTEAWGKPWPACLRQGACTYDSQPPSGVTAVCSPPPRSQKDRHQQLLPAGTDQFGGRGTFFEGSLRLILWPKYSFLEFQGNPWGNQSFSCNC